MSGQFYLQDSRSYVGNDVLWWAKDGNGYTTDLSKAEVYSLDQAQRMHDSRPSDIPWPKAYIDGKTRPAVDMQYIKRTDALPESGITIQEPPRQKPERLKCEGCKRFISAANVWAGRCPSCGTDNRP